MRQNKPKTIALGNFILNSNSKPYIIAEIGVNHEGSIERAKELIQLAKEGGANAVKFQSYKAEKLASKRSPAYWDRDKEKSKNQYELFKKYDKFDQKEYEILADYCLSLKIDFSSTPFDLDAVSYLDPLVSFFKISSSDITNVPLIREIALKKKPVILSTGASNISEIKFAKDLIEENGCKEIILLHCILNYPTNIKNANLRMIKGMRKIFPDNLIGYSDHTIPDVINNPIIIAWLMGAVVIEKHFTYDKLKEGNDHYHSMDKSDLQKTVRSIEQIDKMLGRKAEKIVLPSEKLSRKNARRGIYAAKNLKAGSIIKASDIITKRPVNSLSSKYWDTILGKKVKSSIKKDQSLFLENLE